MDSYHFSPLTNRPASEPIPDLNFPPPLPLMPADSGASPSGRTSVPQPIDFGGSASGYSGASQSRRTNVPQIEYGSSSRNGRTTGSGSRASQRAYWDYPDEVKSRALSEMQQEVARGGTIKSYAGRSTIPYGTLYGWYRQFSGSRPARQHATDEEKSRAISGLQQALENKSSIRKYSKHIGIPSTTLRRWRLEVRGSLQSQRTDTEEGSSRGAR